METPASSVIVDADVHAVVPSVEALLPYLSPHWREVIAISAFKGPTETPYPPNAPVTARPGSVPPDGRPAGSDLELLRRQVLDRYGVRVAILNCVYAIESIHNPDAAAAMAGAVNDWLIADWLEKEPRLRASLLVPVQQPEMAAREIERVGGHAGFVQVLLPVRSEAPYGNRRYHPIYEAAVRHDLVVGIHFGGAPGNPPTAAGWPTFYLEEYVGMAAVFQSQVLSIISEGVFDRFPSLRMALVESGFTWVPSLMWRFDKEWRGLRREIPWVKRPPSEYMREHIRLTTQPVDAPLGTPVLGEVIEQMGSEAMLMFSSDYPHWHDDELPEAVVRGLPEPLARKILGENALSWYRGLAQA